MNSMHDAFITLVYISERDKDNGGGYLIDDTGREYHYTYDMNQQEYVEDDRNNLVAIRITNCINIPNHAFSNCKNLKIVVMDDCVQVIGRGAFYECLSLENIRLSRGTRMIEEYAFWSCDRISSIFIPENCRNIDNGALECDNMMLLTVPMTVDCYICSFDWNNIPLFYRHTQFEDDFATDFEERTPVLHQLCCLSNLRAIQLFEFMTATDQNLEAGWMSDRLGVLDMTALHLLMINPYTSCHDVAILGNYLKLCPKAGTSKDRFGHTPFHYLIHRKIGCSKDMVETYIKFCPEIKDTMDMAVLLNNLSSCHFQTSSLILETIQEIFVEHCREIELRGVESIVAGFLGSCSICDGSPSPQELEK